MRTLLYALLALALPSFAIAQPLADRVPDDALIYIGWTGSRSMPAGFAGSHLQGILDASNLRQVFDEFLPRVIQRVGRDQREAREAMDLIAAVGAPLWRHPSALYVGDVNLENPEGPSAQIALLCSAGDEAPALLERINNVLKRAQNLPFPVQATDYGGLVAVTIHRSDEMDALLGGPTAVAPAPALAKSEKFNAALAQVQNDGIACFYMDVQGALAVADQAVQAGDDPQAAAMWPKVRDALGLNGLHRVIWTGGFDGKDFSSQAFIAAPAPRKGLIPSLLSGEPVSDDALRAVPMDATLVSAGQFDFAKLFADVRTAIGEIDAGAQAQLDEGVNAVNDMLGMNVQQDVLDPLGREWALYCSPTVAGNGILGFTLINRLDDAAKAEQSLTSLETLAQNLIQQQITDENIRVAVRQTKFGDLTIHHWAVPFVSPSWTIKDGNLYVALYPQVVASAADHVSGKGKSILDNAKFIAMRDRLGGKSAVALSYIDLPATASEGYPILLMVSQLYMGLADMFGVESPAMVVPPMHKLLPHLAPAGSVAWVDDAGLHLKGVTPFPGAEIMGSQSNLIVGQNAMLVSILLPSLNRARETANRVKCASNLRQIEQAMLLFANENKGRYPAKMSELLLTQDIGVEVFGCPSSSNSLPPGWNKMPIEELAAWVDENSSYVYMGAGKNSSTPADEILATEKPENHNQDGLNTLYGDGRVEFVPDADAEAADEDFGVQAKAYYSTDDGKTWFTDDITKLSPFDHEGKPAYRVYVFTCDGGKTKFVSHLERYTDEAKEKIEELRDNPGGPPNPMMFEGIMMTGIEVKNPGKDGWVKQSDFQRAQQIMMPVCPDGSRDNLEAVFPD